MMAEAAPRCATYADLEAVPASLVAEIVDGVLETYPRPRPRHAIAASRLSGELDPPFSRGRSGPGGWIFMIEPELRFGSQVVVPDLAGWRGERLPSEPETAWIEMPPVDPGDGVLEAFALTAGQWLPTGTVRRRETVAVPPFDAVPFPLDDLFPFDPPAPSPEA